MPYVTYKNGKTEYFEYDPKKPYMNPGHFNQLTEDDFLVSFHPEIRNKDGYYGLLRTWLNGRIEEEETLP